MRKLTVALAAACWSVTALGQDLLQCLSPDLVQSLLLPYQPGSAVAVTANIPAEFSDYEAPAAFDWIGSIVVESNRTIAFRTSLPTEAAFEATLASLQAAGWERVERATYAATFLLATDASSAESASICRRDESGSLSVRDVAGARYVNISHNGRENRGALFTNQSPCNTSRGVESMFGMFSAGLRQHMPVLRFPPGTTRPGGGSASAGYSGTGEIVRTSIHVSSDDSASNLAEHLGQQMIEQGWLADSSWSGQHGAGSTWSRQPDAETRVLGTLELVTLADQTHEVQFKLRVMH